ncbi:MAG: UDP-N-acetylglucosamine 2-epimerase [Thermoflexales bacterium]|nr:UDP-N-acetylglucosamine 2-epimerase [Thermoflexales bacterium]
MKIASILGAHLDFVQALPISQLLRPQHTETLIYPGRYSDFHVARGYVEHLGIPQPDVHLDIHIGDWDQAFANLFARLERTLIERQPDLVIVRGGGSPALAGALAAARLKIPLAHIDGGRRAYCKRGPEEVNRLVADRLADWVFCSSVMARQRLNAEGVCDGVVVSGDVLLDVTQRYLPLARAHSTILARIGLPSGVYLLAMVESADTLNNPVRLRGLISAFNAIREPIVLPCGPRLRQAIEQLGLTLATHILPIEPVGYLDRLQLINESRAVLTDLDELQREAYFLSIPCVTLHDTTESPETVHVGWNRLAGTQPDQIVSTVRDFQPPRDHPPILGDGHAADRIVDALNGQPIEFGYNYGRAPLSLLSLPVAV